MKSLKYFLSCIFYGESCFVGVSKEVKQINEEIRNDEEMGCLCPEGKDRHVVRKTAPLTFISDS